MQFQKFNESILIIDFGSQVTKLIARRIRELGVFSEIVSHKKIRTSDINESVRGIILSGGPLNVYQINKYSFDKTILELFHGPTLAFKDVAMQLLGNFYEYYLNNENQKINIVVATSGDTGAAAIDAIKGKKNVNIFVLHPDNRVSPVQRKLMTTGKHENVFNIALKVFGDFESKNLFSNSFSIMLVFSSISIDALNENQLSKTTLLFFHLLKNILEIIFLSGQLILLKEFNAAFARVIELLLT